VIAVSSKNGGADSGKPSPSTGPAVCGLVMPISGIDGCTAEHWSDVKTIVSEAVEGIGDPKFQVRLVSDADDVGVIQKRIVQNIYSADMVVCDVSGKNPNVMFELGMRLAFDKPTVIIKDDKTDYSFDTGIIEHIPYPRDLRFNRMVSFKLLLAEKIVATHKAAAADPNHSTFLKNFGKFHIASLSEDVVPADKIVVEMLSEVQAEMVRMRRAIAHEMRGPSRSLQVDGAVQIAGAVSQFLAENPKTKPERLLEDERFARKMEEICDAQKYFSGPSEFEAALHSVLRGFRRQREEVG
jgi:hypothetical protein